jgi:small subunit ribosomal protein S20
VSYLPNIKSAIKRAKVNQKKNLRNRMIKSAMRTNLKKFDSAVHAGTADNALLASTIGAIDRAASKGVIHKNAANRKKARAAKRLAKAGA